MVRLKLLSVFYFSKIDYITVINFKVIAKLSACNLISFNIVIRSFGMLLSFVDQVLNHVLLVMHLEFSFRVSVRSQSLLLSADEISI